MITTIFISTLFLHITHAHFVYQSPAHSSSQSYGFTDRAEASIQFDLTHNLNIMEINTPTPPTPSSPRRFKTQQYFQGLPILGATLVIEEDEDHRQTPLVGHWYNHQQMMQYIPDITPSLSAQEALQIVFDRLNITVNETYGNITNRLCIYHTNRPYLAYNIKLIYLNISQLNDAFQSTSIVHAFHPHNILKHAHEPRSFKACGSGGNDKIGSWWWCGAKPGPEITYTNTGAIPELVSDDFEVFHKGNNLWNSPNDDGIIKCQKVDSTKCKTNPYDSGVNGAYGVALDAYSYCVNTFAMYREWMDETPVTYPKPFPVYVHVGEDWSNANFVGDAINFGDGNGVTYHPLTSASITAHELAHGYTYRYSDLTYSGESGGMNEAYSDIAGESAEYYLLGSTDWINGYDITVADTGPPDDAFRYMKDPPLDTHSVGHWCQYYDEINVHYSSGIYNKAAYLMSVDSTYSFSIEKIFKIFSTANRAYWTEDSTMKEGVCGVLYALDDLYGNWGVYSQMETSVMDSFDSVGLSCGGSETDCDEFGIKCGSNPNKFCYYTTLTPSTSGTKTVSVAVQSWPNNNEEVHFYVHFTIQQFDCINPKLIFKLVRHDYDGFSSGLDEMVEIYDNDLSLIQRCTSSDIDCDITDTCVNVASVNNGATITQGTTYIFLVIVGEDVDAVCSDVILDAQVKLRCAKAPTTSPTPAPTNVPTKYPTPTPTIAPSLNPSLVPTVAPTTTVFPTHEPSNPSLAPTIAPSMSPTNKPTLSPSIAPTLAPSLSPSKYPTTAPSFSPTIAPSMAPSIAPTHAPTFAPSYSPIADPTDSPTIEPTRDPTLDPTINPTIEPTFVPTSSPTVEPTSDPTLIPTMDPTADPTMDPTLMPTLDPTLDPTADPTSQPTIEPTSDPSVDPTIDPTVDPTIDPTHDPTLQPSIEPTSNPTWEPTPHPTEIPTLQPSVDPTIAPSSTPTTAPSGAPTSSPSSTPSQSPVVSPSNAPTLATTNFPTLFPTKIPSMNPSQIPTLVPSIAPSITLTIAPTTLSLLTSSSPQLVLTKPKKEQSLQTKSEGIPMHILVIILVSATGLCICSGCVLLGCAICNRNVSRTKKAEATALREAIANKDKMPKQPRDAKEGKKHQLAVPQKGQKIKSYSTSPAASPQHSYDDEIDMALPHIAEALDDEGQIKEGDGDDTLISPKIVVTGHVRVAERQDGNSEANNVGGRIARAYID
eukprot:778819_1